MNGLFEAGLDGKLAHFTVHMDKLPAAEREPLLAACDRALVRTVGLLRPEIVIGVVEDGPLPRPIIPLGTLEAEILDLVGDEFSVSMPESKRIDGGWTLERIRDALARQLVDPDVDIVITSTGCPHVLLERGDLEGVMAGRAERPLVIIDIAVPRDIEPAINRLNNTYVYDIDDLKNVIEENIEDRQHAALKGERLVDEAVIRFRQWYDSLDVVPTIVALRQQLEDKIRAEAERTRLKLAPKLSEADAEAFEKMTQALVNKILHEPTTLLKRAEGHDDKATLLATTRRLFKLDD